MQYRAVKCGRVQYIIVLLSVLKYISVECSAVKSALQCSAVECSAVKSVAPG